MRSIGRQDIGEVLARLAPSACLDVATGRGQSLAWVARTVPGAGLLVGIDSSLRALAAAGSPPDSRTVHLAACDALAPCFRRGCFDLVSVVNSLHHFTDPRRVLEEASSMLSPRGSLLVSEMYCDRQHPARMTHVLMHSWWAAIDRLNGVTHLGTFTRASILRILGSAGLEIEDIDDDADDPPAMAGEEELQAVRDAAKSYVGRIPQSHPQRPDLERRGRLLEARLARSGFATSAGVTAVCRPAGAGPAVKPNPASTV